jgi:hypothetical protein
MSEPLGGTIELATIEQHPTPIVFYTDGAEEYMRITADRELVLADDVSAQDAAREFAAWVNRMLGASSEEGALYGAFKAGGKMFYSKVHGPPGVWDALVRKRFREWRDSVA